MNTPILPQSGSAPSTKVRKLTLVEQDIEWTFTPVVEPGEYHALSRNARIYRDRRFKRWICSVEFDLLDESLLATENRVTWYLNLGSQERPKASRRTNYWAAWLKANGKPPKRNDRLTPRVFEGRAALVRVGFTSKTSSKNFANPEDRCSVVREVVCWESGISEK